MENITTLKDAYSFGASIVGARQDEAVDDLQQLLDAWPALSELEGLAKQYGYRSLFYRVVDQSISTHCLCIKAMLRRMPRGARGFRIVPNSSERYLAVTDPKTGHAALVSSQQAKVFIQFGARIETQDFAEFNLTDGHRDLLAYHQLRMNAVEKKISALTAFWLVLRKHSSVPMPRDVALFIVRDSAVFRARMSWKCWGAESVVGKRIKKNV